MPASFNHYQASLKRPKPKRFNCSTPAFKYHLSIIALNTFWAFQTHRSRGCLCHYSKHDPQCLQFGLVTIRILGQFYFWYFQTMDGIPFIQCNSRYPLGEGEISPCESLNRCQACTIQQDYTKLSVKVVFVLLWQECQHFHEGIFPKLWIQNSANQGT